MAFHKFNTITEALLFCAEINTGENIQLTEGNMTTGYTYPIEYERFYYVASDSITDKYTDITPVELGFSIPDFTPPQMTGYGILIPTEALALNLFPNDQFKLSGFVIELTSTSQGLAVDLGYLNWQGFRDEQDKPYNSTIKDSFSALWYELLTRYQNNEIIQL